MSGEEARILEKSLASVRKKCRIIKIFCGFSLVVFVGFGVLLFVSALLSNEMGPNASQLIHVVTYVIASSLIIWLSFRIFSDIASGLSPFAMVQVKRIRGIAVCFLAFAIVDFLLSSAFVDVYVLGSLSVGAIADNGANGPQATVDINLMALMASVLAYFFSVAFKYGALLQSDIDDTL